MVYIKKSLEKIYFKPIKLEMPYLDRYDRTEASISALYWRGAVRASESISSTRLAPCSIKDRQA